VKVVLVEPMIPQNTGSIGRLCAANDTPLILVEPLGFSLESKWVKRAGLDYWPWIDLTVVDHFKAALELGALVVHL
jgi:tRNA (cytidine/uridine-2'-O-)-methyltransferase